MLTACLWKFGIAPTSPDPLWHPDGLSIFDASSSLLPDPASKSSIPIKVSRYLGNVLASIAGFCNALCKVGSLSAVAPQGAKPGIFTDVPYIGNVWSRPCKGRMPYSRTIDRRMRDRWQ